MHKPLGFHPRKRLRRRRDFQRAYAQGSRARGSWLIVVAVENGGELTRLGISVGRRAERRAVRRNRLRRLFREAFRLSYADLPPGVDLVLIPAAPEIAPTLDQLRRELVHLARKAHRRYRAKLQGATP